jgi:hypothetical protein
LLKIEDHATDQDQHAHVSNNTHKMDTHALTAQLELLPHKETVDALPHQLALLPVNTLVIQLTATNADNARLDGYHHKTEDHAIDQDQLVLVSNNTHKMDTHASTAQLDQSLPTTTETVSQLQHVLVMDNTSVMLQTATNADNAKPDGYQLKTEDHATDQDQLVLVFNNTLKMDMHVITAQLELLPHKETVHVSVPQPALVLDNTSVIPLTAINADNAKPDGYQLKTEDHATDQDQLVHAFRNTLLMDMLA